MKKEELEQLEAIFDKSPLKALEYILVQFIQEKEAENKEKYGDDYSYGSDYDYDITTPSGAMSIYEQEFDRTEIEYGPFTVEVVYSVGGSEGDGERVERVLKISTNSNSYFFQINGYYSSYEGTEFNDNWFEVEPKDVVVTKYFPKKRK